MNAVRRNNNLLSAKQTLALFHLIEQYPVSCQRHQLLHDLTASFPATWERAENSIEFLCNSGLLLCENNLITICPTYKSGDTLPWFDRMSRHVATLTAKSIAVGEHSRCLQAGDKNPGLWLDSMLFPTLIEGLPIWIIEFGTASRERLNSRFWKISAPYEALFLDAAREANRRHAQRAMTLVQLNAKLIKDSESGLAAEEWVLSYEKRRLASHPISDQIRRISDENVSAGYDVISFSNSTTLHHDFFIEVKSYTGAKRFFWTRNEIAAAEILGEKYCLYLVDSEKMMLPGYEPQIIRGPYSALIKTDDSGWSITATTFECMEISNE